MAFKFLASAGKRNIRYRDLAETIFGEMDRQNLPVDMLHAVDFNLKVMNASILIRKPRLHAV